MKYLFKSSNRKLILPYQELHRTVLSVLCLVVDTTYRHLSSFSVRFLSYFIVTVYVLCKNIITGVTAGIQGHAVSLQ